MNLEKQLGLKRLGDCTRDTPIIVGGRKVYPSQYGRYSSTCEGCSGHEFKQGSSGKEICGNCKWWRALPKNEYESYE